jgi:hypothetical protein
MENMMAGLKALSVSTPPELIKQSVVISEVRGLVLELTQISMGEMKNISLGVADVQKILQGSFRTTTNDITRLEAN